MKKWIPTLCLLASIHANGQTDTLIGRNVSSSKDYRKLTANVCAEAQTEQQKANAIFNWITTHIAYDIELAKNPNRKTETPKSVLSSGKATNNGYVALYVAMAKEAGLHATEVDGYIRKQYYDNGDPHETVSYGWVVVEINGKWYIVDPTAGSGHIAGYTPWLTNIFRKLSKEKLHYDTKERFEFAYSPQCFMVDPLAYRRNVVPIYPMWQLTKVPMPLAVFEAGVTSVDSFNKLHYEIANNNSRMLMLSNMDHGETMMETADEVYAYNKRFVEVKGSKLLFTAIRMFDTNPTEATATEAKEMLKQATGYVKEQKQHFPEHYAALQKNNENKHRETEEYVRLIETSNKLLKAKCDRYQRSCNKKNKAIDDKYKKLKEPLEITKRSDVSVLKKPDAPDMRKLADSFAQRSMRMNGMQKDIERLADSIMIATQKFSNAYDDLAQHAVACFDKLQDETIQRIRLNDQKDDELISLVPVIKAMRLAQLDTMSCMFFDDFDAINKKYDELEKRYDALTDMQALMVKDVAGFKAFTNNAPGLSGEYEGIVARYNQQKANYVNAFSLHMQFNSKMHAMLEKIKEYADEEKGLTEKITIAENARHNKEDKKIKEDRSFDEGLNKVHQEDVRKVNDKIDEYLSKNR